MATPKNGYYAKDGARVPGTTTVIGRFKDSGALIKWAYRQGVEHENMRSRGMPAPADLYEVQEAAADIGTVVHDMVELHVKGRPPAEIEQQKARLPGEAQAKADSAYGAFKSWAAMVSLEVVATEVPMVSELHRFGGTPDCVARINGHVCLLDWKTSNAVYSDYLIQLAAYRELWNECMPDLPITGPSHLLRFSKENGDFAHHFYPDLSEGWRQFLLYRQAYEIDKALKKRAA